MPPTSQKFAITTEVLAELETETRAREEDDDEVREQGPRSCVRLRSGLVEDELDAVSTGEPEAAEASETAEASGSEPEAAEASGSEPEAAEAERAPAVDATEAKAEPASAAEPAADEAVAETASAAEQKNDESALESAPVDAPPNAAAEDDQGIELEMLLGRAAIGSPKPPSLRVDSSADDESIDLDSLMAATRTTGSSAPEENPGWSYWPAEGKEASERGRRSSAAADVHDRDRAALGKKLGLGLALVLGVAGAYFAGASSWRGAAGDSEAASSAPGGDAPLEAADGLAEAPGARPEPSAEAPAEPAGTAAAGDEAPRTSGVLPGADSAPTGGRPTSAQAAPTPAEAVAAGDPAEGEASASAADAQGGEPGEAVTTTEPDPSATVAEPAVASGEQDTAEAEAAEAPEPPAAAPASAAAPAAAPASAAAPAAAAPAGPIPELPSRSDVRRALSRVTPAVRACTEHRGPAMMSITMAGSGNVISARPAGAWAAGANPACLQNAVRGASLPRFRQARFAVQFPFML